MIVWGVELQDKVSQTANAAAAAMGEAADAAKSLRDETSHEGMWTEIFKGELAIEVLKKIGEAAFEVGKEMFSMALEAGEAVERMTSQFQALAGGADGAGEATLAMIRQLEKEVPESEKQVAAWTKSLMAAGVTDMTKLHDSIRAVASAEALVEGGGERVNAVLAKLNEAAIKGSKIKFSPAQLAGTGLAEADVMKQLGMTPKQLDLAKRQGTITGTQIADAMVRALAEKGKGPLATQMDEFGTIITKGKDQIGRLFEGVEIKPFTDALSGFFSIFDQANPSGVALKATIGAAFTFIFDVAGKVFEFLKTAFLDVVIWGLEAAIAVKSFGKWLDTAAEKAAALEPVFVGLGATLLTLFAPSIWASVVATTAWAVTAVPAAIAATIAWGVSLATAAVSMIILNAPLIAIAVGIGLVVAGIVLLVKHWGAVKEFFVNMATGALDAGAALVTGLVDGIRNGVTAAVAAAKHLGTSVLDAVKSIFDVHSPSRVMFDVGANLGEGQALGMESKTDRVSGAAERMGSGVTAGASTSNNSSSVTINVECTINASHATTPQEHRSIVEEEFASLAERLSLMIGSAPSPA